MQQNAVLRDVQIIEITLISYPTAGDGSEIESACYSFQRTHFGYQDHCEVVTNYL